MKFVTAAALREAEQRAILKNPALDQWMMGRAGWAVARAVAETCRWMRLPDSRVRLLAGSGNNGGDAFAAAIHLMKMGWAPELWLTCTPARLKGAARYFFDQAAAAGVPTQILAHERDWPPGEMTSTPPLLVDGLLGTGAKGAPTGVIKRAIEYLNKVGRHSLLLAVDIPSGMDADTGRAEGAVVHADLTITMGFPKAGMARPASLEFLGSLRWAPIDLPAEFADSIPPADPNLQWISPEDVQALFRRRARDSHKGAYGRVLLLGGSSQYPGAIILAAEGALRSGAGLVQMATSPTAAAAAAARIPSAIIRDNLFDPFSFEGMDSILVGPGLGRGPEAERLVHRVLHEAPCPVVLDADALSVVAARPEWVRDNPRTIILTPHPGELAGILKKTAAEIQQDRLSAAREAAAKTGAIVVLKGAGTLVVQKNQPAWLNLTGNPGMASGGSGDVLAGLLAGLLAQKLDPLMAACATVWLHGVAGDIAARKFTQTALCASDIAGALPLAFREMSLR